MKEKIKQEEMSLMEVDDFFQQNFVAGDDVMVHHNEAGITTKSIYDFLLNENSLDL